MGDEWISFHKRTCLINARVVNLLYCALDLSELNQISTCRMAKDIWKALKVTRERTNQFKETKINILVHSYEMFRMKLSETIK